MLGRVFTPLDMSHVLSTERTSVPYALLSFINTVCLLWLIQGAQSSTLFMPVISCPGQDIENVTGLQCAGSDPGLKLHCVPRDEDGQLGLVCTLWIWLGTDICPAYSEKHQQIVYRTCKGNESECPSDGQYHKSFEAYKYKGCIPDMTKSSGTTTQADTTQQPSPCSDCADGGSTGSTTGTETTTKSTLPTDSESNIISETSKQSMSCVMPVVTAFILPVIVSFLLMVWEYHIGKSLLRVISGHLKNGSCGHSTTGAVQVPQGDADKPMLKQLTSGQGSAAGMNHNQQVLRQTEVCGQN